MLCRLLSLAKIYQLEAILLETFLSKKFYLIVLHARVKPKPLATEQKQLKKYFILNFFFFKLKKCITR